MPSIQGTQYYEEDLVLRDMVPSMNDRPSVREPGTNGNHALIGQAKNDGYSDKSQQITVSMDNVLPEGNEDQYVKYPSGEYLGRNVHMRRSECTRKSPQQYDPVFGASREWNNDAVASIVYMIQDGDIYSNIDTDDIMSLLVEWDAEDGMDMPSTFHMI